MGLTTAYLVSVRNLPDFLNAIRTAQAPKNFTTRFLLELDFKSTNDRLFIGLLKGLRFLDDGGVPTQRYFDYLDQTRSGAVLAEAVRDAYEDLFRVNTKANELSIAEIKNKLRTLTQGQKSAAVIEKMASTFKGLCDQATWTGVAAKEEPPGEQHEVPPRKKAESSERSQEREGERKGPLALHYNLQLILPDTRDPAVFDALFRSLREHLL